MKMCRIHNMNTIGYSICESHNASYLENDDVRFSVMIGSPMEAFSTVPKSCEKRHCPKENMRCLHIPVLSRTWYYPMTIFMEFGQCLQNFN